MKNILLLIVLSVFIFSCEQQEFIETGNAQTYYDETMIEVMKRSPYDWDSTLLVIERAGLTDLFEGKDPDYPQFTFLGCTNLSILHYMLEPKEFDGWEPVLDEEGLPVHYSKVSEIPVEVCKEFILKHIIDGKYMKSDFPKGIDFPKSGGKDIEGITGNKFWIRTYTDPWQGIPDSGPTHLYVAVYGDYDWDGDGENDIDYYYNIGSADIECKNGVIHSLHYDYIFGNL